MPPDTSSTTDAPYSAGIAGARAEGSDSSSEIWAAFASATSGEAFCTSWLTLQCSLIAGVRAALLLLRDEAAQSYVPAAIWPDRQHDVTYLSGAAERALTSRGSLTLTAEADDGSLKAGTVQIAYPVECDGELYGAAVFDLAARAAVELQAVRRQLLWGTGWLESLLRRHKAARDTQALEDAAAGLALVQTANERKSLDEAAIAAVNELVTRCRADRVSLGVQRKGRLKVRALSRTAWFDPKSQLIDTIASAMEETIDQETAIAHPPLASASGKVNVAQRDLAVRVGAGAVLSVPLMSRGAAVGALSFERNQAPAFEAREARQCELIGELLGPVLEAKLDHERWVAGRAVDGLARFRDRLLGPRHPTLKLATALAVLAALFLCFAEGKFRVSAKTVIEGAVQRAAVAPFEGYIAQAYVRAGDSVRQGQVLAVLDDRDLKLEQVRWESEKEQVAGKYREALAKRDRAASRILAAQLSQAEAQLALADEKLARTRLVAPFDGTVVSGDLSQLLGSPVEQGKVLFELAPLDAYRVILKVDERDIVHVATGQRGELALTGLAHASLPFSVKTVTSVSTPHEGRNYFRVEAQLEDSSAKLRPGMEGVGKIAAGEARYIWIWTRGFVDWLRITFWTWLP
jgi:biotin carboxyl carrier protein